MLKKEAQDQVHNYYNKFNVNTSTDKMKLTNSIATLPSVDQHDNSSIMTDVHCTWADKDHKLKLTVLCGTNQSDSNNNNSVYVSTNSHNRLLTEMCLSHAIGDFCLIGGKGCGKTTLVHKFANMLNYDVTTVMLYQVHIWTIVANLDLFLGHE
jgi:midasin (ATPase involved in ribosome maturation)